MSDPLRTKPIIENSTPPIDAADRDAKIESLLLSGLDHYFASDYAQAIDVWTRALFLDRQHPRARAYVDRARSALAEQQRESEELLHNGVEAFERGEIEAARLLLNAAVQRGGAHEVALAFLTRIDRINAAAPAEPAPSVVPIGRQPLRPSVPSVDRVTSPWRRVVLLVAALALGGLMVASRDQLRAAIPFLSSGQEANIAPVPVVQEPLIVPRSSETAIERARALFESGRLYDALRAVDLVRPADPLRADADRLKAAIQRELLAHLPPTTTGAPTTKP
jgi:tetratricopeptide (TPR) repeat protein